VYRRAYATAPPLAAPWCEATTCKDASQPIPACLSLVIRFYMPVLAVKVPPKGSLPPGRSTLTAARGHFALLSVEGKAVLVVVPQPLPSKPKRRVLYDVRSLHRSDQSNRGDAR